MKSTDQNQWFKLDNAGKLYPSIASSRVSTTFRMTYVLKDKVDPKELQEALNECVQRYPLFNVELKKGFFWYYFQKRASAHALEKEKYFPCTSTNLKGNDPVPFKLLYFEKKIHLETSHAIADGAGAIAFLNDIFRLYCIKKYKLDTRLSPISAEDQVKLGEDAFKNYYQPGLPMPSKTPKAFHFPFKLMEKGIYHISTGLFSSSMLKEKAKNYGTSPTKFLLCLYFETIQEYLYTSKGKKEPIVLNMPVNLRGIFPSETMRNFFVSITPMIDPRLGIYSREEIMNYLDAYFSLMINEKNLKRHITSNYRKEALWHIRIVPLFIKDRIIPYAYNHYGETRYTSSLSSLGQFTIEAPYDDYIQHVEVLPPPSTGNIIKITTISFKDTTALSFGSLSHEKIIEQIFFKKLRAEGIPIKLETNYHYDQ